VESLAGLSASAALPDPGFWRGKRVLLTGHTGFKGAWAALWLARMGAEVTGLSLPADELSLFALADVGRGLRSRLVDLRDAAAVDEVVAEARPELVLHMAAQPIVRRSLVDPVETFATNVLGTVHLLDALRRSEGVRAILVVTSDKVYHHGDHPTAFAEDDRLGGVDPYSASKAACEIAVASFAQSLLAPRGIACATARGGNVVGGGDFAADRLVPDAVRAARANTPLVLRHPGATRPWQHVLDCVNGYFVYLEGLGRGHDLPAALNFGPPPDGSLPVSQLASAVLTALGVASDWEHRPQPGSVEMQSLAIDSSLARRVLGWRDRLTGDGLVDATAGWYRAWADGADMRRTTLDQIAAFEAMP
jgi:CDP-glucose 4,6-dehydratase